MMTDEITIEGKDGKMVTIVSRGETYDGKQHTVNRCACCGEMILAYEGKFDTCSSKRGRTVRKNLAEKGEVPMWVSVPTNKPLVTGAVICNDCHRKDAKLTTKSGRKFSVPATVPACTPTPEMKLRWLEGLKEMKENFGEQVLILADVTTPSGEWAVSAALRLGMHIKHVQGVHA